MTTACAIVPALPIVNGYSAAEPVDQWVRQIQSGNILVEAGELDQAEVIYNQSWIQAETAGDDLRVAVVLQNLGKLLYRRGHTLEATIKPDGTGVRRLTTFPANDAHAVWTDDGKYIMWNSGGYGFKFCAEGSDRSTQTGMNCVGTVAPWSSATGASPVRLGAAIRHTIVSVDQKGFI